MKIWQIMIKKENDNEFKSRERKKNLKQSNLKKIDMKKKIIGFRIL